MDKIDPKNLTAQLAYRARGNSPGTLPMSTISNCFPGLEFDFRNLWRRLLEGIELHEAGLEVVRVDDDAPPEVQSLRGQLLIAVDGVQVWTPVTGPTIPNGMDESLGIVGLEWANSLSHVFRKGGSRVPCSFFSQPANEVTEIDLTVRPVFDRDPDDGSERPVLARELAQPGELTQSLCSPWQNDYVECACYYWAASRPDYVNVELNADGTSAGHNWLHKDRDENTPKEYSLRSADLVSYEDMFRNWEKELKFILRGKDAE